MAYESVIYNQTLCILNVLLHSLKIQMRHLKKEGYSVLAWQRLANLLLSGGEQLRIILNKTRGNLTSSCYLGFQERLSSLLHDWQEWFSCYFSSAYRQSEHALIKSESKEIEQASCVESLLCIKETTEIQLNDWKRYHALCVNYLPSFATYQTLFSQQQVKGANNDSLWLLQAIERKITQALTLVAHVNFLALKKTFITQLGQCLVNYFCLQQHHRQYQSAPTIPQAVQYVISEDKTFRKKLTKKESYYDSRFFKFFRTARNESTLHSDVVAGPG